MYLMKKVSLVFTGTVTPSSPFTLSISVTNGYSVKNGMMYPEKNRYVYRLRKSNIYNIEFLQILTLIYAPELDFIGPVYVVASKVKVPEATHKVFSPAFTPPLTFTVLPVAAVEVKGNSNTIFALN